MLQALEWILFAALTGFAWQPSGPLAVLITAGVCVQMRTGYPRWTLFGMYVSVIIVMIGLAGELVVPGQSAGHQSSAASKPLVWGFLSASE